MIEMLIGALILLVGIVIGRLSNRSKFKAIPTKQPKEPKPICGCEHHYSFHDEEGCNFNYGYWEDAKYLSRPCNCKKYSGPEPLPRYISGI